MEYFENTSRLPGIETLYFETVEPKKVSQVLEKKYSVCTVCTVCKVCSLHGLRFGITPSTSSGLKKEN